MARRGASASKNAAKTSLRRSNSPLVRVTSDSVSTCIAAIPPFRRRFVSGKLVYKLTERTSRHLSHPLSFRTIAITEVLGGGSGDQGLAGSYVNSYTLPSGPR